MVSTLAISAYGGLRQEEHESGVSMSYTVIFYFSVSA
jgi:hypothetical protein